MPNRPRLAMVIRTGLEHGRYMPVSGRGGNRSFGDDARAGERRRRLAQDLILGRKPLLMAQSDQLLTLAAAQALLPALVHIGASAGTSR